MASAFGHAAASIGISVWKKREARPFLLFGLMALSAVFPDIDSAGYFLGIPYESIWGHRGFTHSILFAVLWSLLLARIFFRKQYLSHFVFLFLATLSHGLIDACTTGGLGVGFFIPFDQTRYFFSYHPILVSPIGIKSFFTTRGLQVLSSEAIWIGVPTLISVILSRFA